MSAQLAERPLHETGMQASRRSWGILRCLLPCTYTPSHPCAPHVHPPFPPSSSPHSPAALPQVHASQLHAPGLVLLGDAAHAVSPATSNGMNSALEDAAVLARAVAAAGGDLAAAPQQYTALRLEDVRALLWLDGALSGVAGRSAGGCGGSDAGRGPRAARAAVVARVALGALTRGWVRPHALVRLKDGGLPYAEARRAVERDAALVRVVTTGAGLTVVAGAAGALLAAGAARLRR